MSLVMVATNDDGDRLELTQGQDNEVIFQHESAKWIITKDEWQSIDALFVGGGMTTTCTKACPHRAAVENRPWQTFDSYAKAAAWVARQPQRPGYSWIRCAIHQPTPNELRAAGGHREGFK